MGSYVASDEKLRMYGVGGSQARPTAAGCLQLGGRISRFDKARQWRV